MPIRMRHLAPFMAALVACSPGVRVSSDPAAAVTTPPTGTVIVANMGDNSATLIDVASRRTVATLPTGNGAHEVAVSRNGRWAVVSNYGARGAPGRARARRGAARTTGA